MIMRTPPTVVPILAAFALVLVSCRGREPSAPQATASERAAFKQRLIASTIEGAFATVPDSSSEEAWRGAFWGMELIRYTSDSTTRALQKAFSSFDRHSTEFQRSLLEVAYTLYPEEFAADMERILITTESPKLFAMAALHLERQDQEWRWRILRTLDDRFAEREAHPILAMLRYQLSVRAAGITPVRPPLVDLLAYPLRAGAPVVFSFQRPDRRYSGLLVVRDRAGRFMRDAEGGFARIPQLALSANNLAGYLTNGNTPQGIMSFQGYDVSTSVFIGPTTNVQLVLPHEVPPGTYFHGRRGADTAWTHALYAEILPPSWRDYTPVYEAYYAGEAGRTEIIAHGTAIDPEFYRGEPCYPTTPSLGCLTAFERWSPEDGRRLSSDQQSLIDMLQGMDFADGFFVIVEIDHAGRPVAIEDVLADLVAADARAGSR